MSRQYFGTDGIRGTANKGSMTAEIALKVAMAVSCVLRRGDHRHKVVIGKDTRLSGYMIESAMVAGFTSMGMDVVLVGPMPTPAIAMLTKSLRADLGVMISASHNPYQDNGIKLFGADGYKLSDEVELEIEAQMEQSFDNKLADPDKIGRARRLEDETGRYAEHVKRTFPKDQNLDGLKIVIDCAHGAAYKAAPGVLWELGAEVIAIGTNPTGKNINRDCGAMAPQILQETVVKNGADIGIALDGDADRILVCDELGKVIDGDQIMALIATDWHKRGLLKQDGVAATVMSNLGLEKHLKDNGMHLKRTDVGDRYVVKEMSNTGYNLGGEQSGHIIIGDYSSTGDGLLAGLQVLSILKKSGQSASTLCNVFTPVPQLLKNVRYEGVVSLEDTDIQLAISQAKECLGDAGRILVRKSGTEPLIRVMAEGNDIALIETLIENICQAVEKTGQRNAA